MQTVVPPHIVAVLDGLLTRDDDLSRAAAGIITAFVKQAVPDLVGVCLNTNTVSRGGVTVKVSPNQAVVVELLAKRSEAIPGELRVVSAAELHRALWGCQAHTHSINTVRVMMCELRKRLAPIKVAIQNHNGRGYRLDLQPITLEGN